MSDMSLEQLRGALAVMRDAEAAQEPLLVHCSAGSVRVAYMSAAGPPGREHDTSFRLRRWESIGCSPAAPRAIPRSYRHLPALNN
jgi:hypothetical protein